MFAYAEVTGCTRQCTAADYRGANERENSFLLFGIAFIDFVGDCQVEHGVAQKLQSLIALKRRERILIEK